MYKILFIKFLKLFVLLQVSPKASDIAPLLYTIYTSDLPTTIDTTVGIYADDTALLLAIS